MSKRISLFLVLLTVITQTGCWITAQEGTVEVQTIWDKINRVVRAGDGGIWTVFTIGDEYYTVDLHSFTSQSDVGASTKDNAALNIKIAVTAKVTDTDESINEYVRKFGLDQKTRHERRDSILLGQINTETKNVVAQYDAYSLLANQEKIQAEILQRLKPIFQQQLLMNLESVQIIGRPDFLDDRIEQAASAVVANQKQKEAEQASLEASRIIAERKQVEAQAFANPSLFKIRELELQKEIAEAWAKHQGTLVLGGDGRIQLKE